MGRTVQKRGLEYLSSKEYQETSAQLVRQREVAEVVTENGNSRMRELLQAMDYTKDAAAKIMHVAPATLSRIVLGRRRWSPAVRSAQFVSAFMGMSVHDILFRLPDETYIEGCTNDIIIPNIYGALFSSLPEEPTDLESELLDIAEEVWNERKSCSDFLDRSAVELDVLFIQERIKECLYTRGLSTADITYSVFKRLMNDDGTRESKINAVTMIKAAMVFHTAVDYFLCADYTRYCDIYYRDWRDQDCHQVSNKLGRFVGICARADHKTRDEILLRAFRHVEQRCSN